jgi:hypothetical protein
MNAVAKGDITSFGIVSKGHDKTIFINAEVREGDDVTEHQFAVVVELKEVATQDEGVVTPSPRVETLVYRDCVRGAEMSVSEHDFVCSSTEVHSEHWEHRPPA